MNGTNTLLIVEKVFLSFKLGIFCLISNMIDSLFLGMQKHDRQTTCSSIRMLKLSRITS